MAQQWGKNPADTSNGIPGEIPEEIRGGVREEIP